MALLAIVKFDFLSNKLQTMNNVTDSWPDAVIFDVFSDSIYKSALICRKFYNIVVHGLISRFRQGNTTKSQLVWLNSGKIPYVDVSELVDKMYTDAVKTTQSPGYLGWIADICRERTRERTRERSRERTNRNPLVLAIGALNLDAADYFWGQMSIHSHEAVIEQLIRHTETDSEKISLLDQAAVECIQYIETKYAFKFTIAQTYRVVDKYGRNCDIIGAIVCAGFVELYKMMFKRALVEWKFEEYQPHHVLAACHGRVSMLKYLLPDRANFSTTSIPLAAYRGHVEVVQYLVDRYGGRVGPAAITYAISSGSIRMVKYFTENPPEHEPARMAPYEGLIDDGHFDMIDWLLTVTNRKNPEYIPQLDFVAPITHDAIREAVNWVDHHDDDFWSYERKLKFTSPVEIVKWLVCQGCPIVLQFEVRGYKPIDLIQAAIRNRDAKMIKWLLDWFKIGATYDEAIIGAAIEKDIVELIEIVWPESLYGYANIALYAADRGSRRVLNWLRTEYKSTDFRISEDAYLEALEILENKYDRK